MVEVDDVVVGDAAVDDVVADGDVDEGDWAHEAVNQDGGVVDVRLPRHWVPRQG